MSSSPHTQHRFHQHYRNSISPSSTYSEDESEPSQHSQPNDLSTNSGTRKHGSGQSHSSAFPSYTPFYTSSHHGSSLGTSQHSSSQNMSYVSTNECRIIEYQGARIAAFLSANRTPCEYLLCLPQAFDLFLKHLVGGLHTVYTKLKVIYF